MRVSRYDSAHKHGANRANPVYDEDAVPEPLAIEVHKALADDTRYRLYRHLRLSGSPVAARGLATRLSLHATTPRTHRPGLEEVGPVAGCGHGTAPGAGRAQ